MKFEIDRASLMFHEGHAPAAGAKREGDEWTIEINTLEELLRLADVNEAPIVVSRECLTIYDDYLE